MYVGNTGETLPAMAPLPDTYDHTPQGKWSEPCHFCSMRSYHLISGACQLGSIYSGFRRSST